MFMCEPEKEATENLTYTHLCQCGVCCFLGEFSTFIRAGAGACLRGVSDAGLEIVACFLTRVTRCLEVVVQQAYYWFTA